MPVTFDATFDWTFDSPNQWTIAGAKVAPVLEEVAGYQTLELSVRVPTDVLTSSLRPLKENQGQLSTRPTDSGGYRAIDRANGNNTYAVQPPGRRQPLRRQTDYLVRSYSESLVRQETDQWTVDLELVPAASRTDTPSSNIGYALDFDGQDDSVVANDVSSIQYDPNTDDHTISFFMKPQDLLLASEEFLFSKISEEADYLASIQTNGDLEWIVIPSSGPSSQSLASLPDLMVEEERVLVQLEVDNTSGTTIYINTDQVATNSESWSSAAQDTAAPDLYIGARQSGSSAVDTFNGAIDEFQIHGKTLSASERQTIFDGGAVTDQRLVYYDFDEGPGSTTVADAEGGPNGTVNGATFKSPTGLAEWGFDTRYGQVLSDRVDAQFEGSGDGGVERFELTARLTFDEARLVEAALAKLSGVRIRTIADGDNVVVDDTNGDMTVTVTAPANDVVSDGDYVALDWESTRLNDAFQSVALTLVKQ